MINYLGESSTSKEYYYVKNHNIIMTPENKLFAL